MSDDTYYCQICGLADRLCECNQVPATTSDSGVTEHTYNPETSGTLPLGGLSAHDHGNCELCDFIERQLKDALDNILSLRRINGRLLAEAAKEHKRRNRERLGRQ